MPFGRRLERPWAGPPRLARTLDRPGHRHTRIDQLEARQSQRIAERSSAPVSRPRVSAVPRLSPISMTTPTARACGTAIAARLGGLVGTAGPVPASRYCLAIEVISPPLSVLRNSNLTASPLLTF